MALKVIVTLHLHIQRESDNYIASFKFIKTSNEWFDNRNYSWFMKYYTAAKIC